MALIAGVSLHYMSTLKKKKKFPFFYCDKAHDIKFIVQ